MRSESTVSIRGLSKAYRLYDHPGQRVLEWITRRPRHRTFWALRGIDLEVAPGTALGLVGPNGAGKSTLLKVLSGVSSATEGFLSVRGKVTALLELGTGFHPELTGRENIFLNARLVGYTDQEIRAGLDRIIAFSELGSFIDQPVRTYSSGMAMRLGFSIASGLSPDVLIIDEVFAVGDAYFQQKCVHRLQEFKASGATILFVSHDPGAVKTLCDQAVLLHHGQIADFGAPDDVLDYYNALIAREHGDAGFLTITRQQTDEGEAQRAGTFEAVVSDLRLLDTEGNEVKAVVAGQRVTLKVRVAFFTAIDNPTIGILIRDRLGTDIFGTNTYHLGQQTGSFQPGDEIETSWEFGADLGPGQYTVTVAVHTMDVHVYRCFDWADAMLAFEVLPRSDYQFIGKAHLPVQLSLQRQDAKGDLTRVLQALYPQARPDIEMTDEAHLLHGWHAEESDGAHVMRWTKRRFGFVLRGPAKAVCLSAACPRADAAADPAHGKVWINGAEAGTITVDSTELKTVSVPAHCSAETPLRVDVELEKAWFPVESGDAEDRRELGIYVRRAWVETE